MQELSLPVAPVPSLPAVPTETLPTVSEEEVGEEPIVPEPLGHMETLPSLTAPGSSLDQRKCRALFGQKDKKHWCKPCLIKKKCIGSSIIFPTKPRSSSVSIPSSASTRITRSTSVRRMKPY